VRLSESMPRGSPSLEPFSSNSLGTRYPWTPLFDRFPRDLELAENLGA